MSGKDRCNRLIFNLTASLVFLFIKDNFLVITLFKQWLSDPRLPLLVILVRG